MKWEDLVVIIQFWPFIFKTSKNKQKKFKNVFGAFWLFTHLFYDFLAIFSCWCLLKQVKKNYKKIYFNAFANNACVIILLEEEGKEILVT